MKRIKAIVAYDGSAYSGFQIQKNSRTIQEMIEKALTRMHKGETTKIVSSGRTDAGVHAKGQVFHFDSPIHMSGESWVRALNGLLPTNIVIQHVEIVSSDFHARYDVVGKTYKYFLHQGDLPNPFKHHYSTYFPYQLDIELMRKGAQHFVGTYDFTSFCSAKTEKDNKVRTITAVEVDQTDEGFVFTFTGNGFLYNMVRIMVGTLLNVGSKRLAAEKIPQLIAAKDRKHANKTAPAQGLYLWEVYYNN